VEIFKFRVTADVITPTSADIPSNFQTWSRLGHGLVDVVIIAAIVAVAVAVVVT